MGKSSENCYCAFCKHERKVYKRKHLSWTNVGQVLLFALLLMGIVWGDFDPQVVLFVAIGLLFTEIFIRFRWRLSLTCKYCGFDPMLYIKSPEIACDKVKQTLDSKKTDSFRMFKSKNPFKNLHVIQKTSSGSIGERLLIEREEQQRTERLAEELLELKETEEKLSLEE